MFDKERIRQLRRDNIFLAGFENISIGYVFLILAIGNSNWADEVGDAANYAVGLVVLVCMVLLFYITYNVYKDTFGHSQKDLQETSPWEYGIIIIAMILWNIGVFYEEFGSRLSINPGGMVFVGFALLIFVQSRGKRWGYGLLAISAALISCLPYLEMLSKGRFVTSQFFVAGLATSIVAIGGGLFDHYWMLRTLLNEQVGEASG